MFRFLPKIISSFSGWSKLLPLNILNWTLEFVNFIRETKIFLNFLGSYYFYWGRALIFKKLIKEDFDVIKIEKESDLYKFLKTKWFLNSYNRYKISSENEKLDYWFNDILLIVI